MLHTVTDGVMKALAGIALYILLQQVGMVRAIPFPFTVEFGGSSYDLAPPAVAEVPKKHK